ncbi:MAG: uracil-DNA glycosylase [Polyangiaceae bacterium]|nr:uracil-DNA glycosylase [Polyangiaceae bacterium]
MRATRTLAEQLRASGASGVPAAPRHVAVATRPSSTSPAVEHAPLPPAPPPLPEASTTPPEERARSLAALSAEVVGCTRCALAGGRTQTVFARGNPLAELCFVGEGPGADEDASGLPFVGQAGQLLDKMIAAMGYAPDEVYICNIVKCRPPGNRKPEPEELSACLPYLHQQLALVSPKVIVALGATAAHGLLGAPVAITRARGSWRLYAGRVPVMPTLHPAYLLRQPEAKRDVWRDLQAVMERLGKKR